MSVANIKNMKPIDYNNIICHPIIYHSYDGLFLPAVTVTIIPITQINAVLVKFKMALAKALMYFVILNPIKLKKVIDKIVAITIVNKRVLLPISLKYCSGL